ncbi:MAG: hypothetical protein LBR80_12430 [Deltaproteobacteria bacterium]|nr:hypothetical protein [Deltaproteobacteria bacterium]
MIGQDDLFGLHGYPAGDLSALSGQSVLPAQSALSGLSAKHGLSGLAGQDVPFCQDELNGTECSMKYIVANMS